jgi:ribonuclease HII
MWEFEERAWAAGYRRVCGVDEAGRGPLAGPVSAAACLLPPGYSLEGLNDSKQVPPETRERLFYALTTDPTVSYGIGWASVAEIDRYNILYASFLAMHRALAALVPPPDLVLVDGNQKPDLGIECLPIVEGDGRSFSIAAASILAKVARDRLMQKLDAHFPGYGFAEHKGYATAAHLAALHRLGPSLLHRKSFAPVSPQLTERTLFDSISGCDRPC